MSSTPSSATDTTLGAGDDAARSWSRPGFSPGETIGRYAILERIGAGGMGVVYAAYDPKLDRKVAIKVLHPSTRQGGTRGQARLAREAQALARLNHPNVVTVNDVGLHDGRVFVAMDFIEGRTLRTWLDTRRPWREVVRVVTQAGRGLAAAHDNGLVHRDFKPDNVMIGEGGRVVVMDFGLAHPITSRDEDDASLSSSLATGDERTQAGRLVGTPLYMAPEQFAGAEVGPRTDVFAFCVVLWEGLHGARPFAGKTPAELARQVGEGRVRAVPSGSGVPGALRRIALRGLAVDPEARWSSMHELLRALARDPVARRRRLLGVGTAILLGAAIVGGRATLHARTVDACRERLGSMDGAWNPERKAAIGLALRGTGVSYAGDVAERTGAALDDMSEAWSDERERICARAPRLDDARVAAVGGCLDHARAEIAALAELLEAADAEIVPRATRMVAALPSPRRCQDGGPGGGGSATRSAPLVAAPEHRARLSRSSANLAAARFDDALADAEAVLAALGTSGDRSTRALAEWAAANALDGLGRYEEARARYEAMFYEAAERDDPLAVRAAGQLVWTTGTQLGRHDEALQWYRTAQAQAERLGMRDDPEIGDVLNFVGSVHELRGEYAEALAAHERALAIRVTVHGPDHRSVATSLNNIAVVHQARGELDVALSTMRSAVDISTRLDGPMHPDVAMMLGNLGNLHWARGEAEQALELQERALAIEEATLGLQHPRVARTILNLGVLQLGREEWDLALASFERALAIQESTLGAEHLDVAATLNNIGIVHFHREAYDPALAAYERALAIRRDVLGPVHQRVGTLHENIGQVHQARGELDRAAAAYRSAADVLQRALGGEHALVGLSLSHLGSMQLELGDAGAAVDTLDRALAVLETTKGDPDLLAATRFALARALASVGGDVARARALADLSLRHHDGTGDDAAARRVRRWLAAAPRP